MTIQKVKRILYGSAIACTFAALANLWAVFYAGGDWKNVAIMACCGAVAGLNVGLARSLP